MGQLQAAGKSAKWIREVFACLSSVFSSAIELGFLEENPCLKVKLPRVPPPEFQWYDADQTARWLSVCEREKPSWLPYFFFLFRTGARLGEAAGLQWEDVDFLRQTVRLRQALTVGLVLEEGELVRKALATTPKNHTARTIPMSPELSRMLQAHRHLGNRVFLTPEGQPCLRSNMRRTWEFITKLAGLPLLSPHDIRHSFASQLVSAGVSLLAVKELLGHGSLTMTLRYAHLAPAVGAQAVALLDGGRTRHTTGHSRS